MLRQAQHDTLYIKLITNGYLVGEFRQYLSSEGLLPNWRGYMDVCNCAREADRLIKAETYICPASSGAYSHQRCEYLGMYWEMGVWQMAAIRGVVDVYPSDAPDSEWETEVLWNNKEELSKSDLITLAKKKFRDAYQDNNDWDARVFVLGKLHKTTFEKDTPGGMRGKRYFWVGSDDDKSESVAEVAQRLRGKVWSNYFN